jgi:cytochrome c553
MTTIPFRLTTLLFCALLVPSAFAKGDPVKGKALVAASKCETCHDNKVMGTPGAIYLRKDRKVTDLARLKAQVSMCTTQLNLALFPEDEEDIVAWLDQAWYKFNAPK